MKQLQNAQDAVKQAIEGGYEGAYIETREGSGFLKGGIGIINEQYLTDPLFWQALGRVRGWGQEISKGEHEWGTRICLHCNVDTAYQPSRESGCNHAHYPEACKICTNKQTTAKQHAKDWFDNHYDLKEENKFWQSLP